MNGAIRRVLVARYVCTVCRPAEGTHTLQMTLKSGSVSIRDKAEVGMQWVPWFRRIPWWAYAIAGAALLGLLLLVSLLVRKPAKSEIGAPAPEFPPLPVYEPEPPGYGELVETVPSRALIVQLATVKGKNPGHKYEVRLRDRITIGRGQDCDVVVPDGEASRRHCELVATDGCVLLRDSKSTHGTQLNGAPVKYQARLEPGDMIRLGRTELRINFDKRQNNTHPTPAMERK
jgi:hypothetical protein